MGSSQKRALQNYRTRLSERGLSRFEVLGRNADRDLIRSLARRPAEDGPDASRLRAAVSRTIEGQPPKKGGIVAALRRSPLVGANFDVTRSREEGRVVEMRYLLDTNIISNVTKTTPSESLLAWMAEQDDDGLFISSLTVAKIRRGVLEKPLGRRRDQLEAWFGGPEGPQALFAGRVLPFDERAALIWARLMADGKSRGQRRSALDTNIRSGVFSDTPGWAEVTPTRWFPAASTSRRRPPG